MLLWHWGFMDFSTRVVAVKCTSMAANTTPSSCPLGSAVLWTDYWDGGLLHLKGISSFIKLILQVFCKLPEKDRETWSSTEAFLVYMNFVPFLIWLCPMDKIKFEETVLLWKEKFPQYHYITSSGWFLFFIWISILVLKF